MSNICFAFPISSNPLAVNGAQFLVQLSDSTGKQVGGGAFSVGDALPGPTLGTREVFSLPDKVCLQTHPQPYSYQRSCKRPLRSCRCVDSTASAQGGSYGRVTRVACGDDAYRYLRKSRAVSGNAPYWVINLPTVLDGSSISRVLNAFFDTELSVPAYPSLMIFSVWRGQIGSCGRRQVQPRFPLALWESGDELLLSHCSCPYQNDRSRRWRAIQGLRTAFARSSTLTQVGTCLASDFLMITNQKTSQDTNGSCRGEEAHDR